MKWLEFEHALTSIIHCCFPVKSTETYSYYRQTQKGFTEIKKHDIVSFHSSYFQSLLETVEVDGSNFIS